MNNFGFQKNIELTDELVELLKKLKLTRTYKAMCPICGFLSESANPDIRIVIHEDCKQRFKIIQKLWRNKAKVSKL